MNEADLYRLRRLAWAEFALLYFQKQKFPHKLRYLLIEDSLALIGEELGLETLVAHPLEPRPNLSREEYQLSEAVKFVKADFLKESLALIRKVPETDLKKDLLKTSTDVIIWSAREYPERVINSNRPALFIWTRGPARELLYAEHTAAVIGSRSASGYGLKVAGELAKVLADYSICLVSGLARGIDSTGQTAILNSGGQTIGVMGGGFEHPYPKSSYNLFNRLYQDSLVLAVFPPEERTRPWHFPERNQLIAALADELFVIEAGRNSGSLITAHAALDFGRNVWAVPGSIYKAEAYACNALISDGAAPLYDFAELRRYLERLTESTKLKGEAQHLVPRKEAQMESLLRDILLSLEEESLSLAGLISKFKIAEKDLRSILGSALVQGLLINRGGKYILTAQGISSIYST
ncbi:MAG: DNA-processing protein DprA [Eubacteriales bacterium]|nr:DNA-processing protein DprA [Eubacteriales bacterium]